MRCVISPWTFFWLVGSEITGSQHHQPSCSDQSGVRILVGSIQLASFTWCGFQYLQNSSEDMAQSIIYSPWRGTKSPWPCSWLNLKGGRLGNLPGKSLISQFHQNWKLRSFFSSTERAWLHRPISAVSLQGSSKEHSLLGSCLHHSLWWQLCFFTHPFKVKVKESEVAQSCPTLCDPMEYSPPVSSVHRGSPGKNWGGLPFPSPGDLPNPGIEPGSPASQADPLPSEPPGEPLCDEIVQNNI